MPSIVAPSLDFHSTTSRVARAEALYGAPISVRYRGAKSGVEEKDLGEMVGRRFTRGQSTMILGEGRAAA